MGIETPAERGMSPLTPAQRATAETLVGSLRAVKDCNDEPSKCYLDSGPYCGQHVENDTFTPLLREAADTIAALLAATEPPWQDDRRRAAQQATWSRAATVVSYYTGRDLDVMDAEFDAEHCTLPAPPETGE